MKITMTMMVGNDVDIIADHITYHKSEGISAFRIFDNGSTDGTRDILDALSGVIVEDAPLSDDGLTQLAVAAFNDGADWVLNATPRELWVPDTTTRLYAELEKVSSASQIVSVPVAKMVGVVGDTPWYSRYIYVEQGLASTNIQAARGRADVAIGVDGSITLPPSMSSVSSARSFALARVSGRIPPVQAPALAYPQLTVFRFPAPGGRPIFPAQLAAGIKTQQYLPDSRIADRMTLLHALITANVPVSTAPPANSLSPAIPADGVLTTDTVNVLQNMLAVPVTGTLDDPTVLALQTVLNVTPGGGLGPQTVGALQIQLGIPQSTQLDSDTIAALQRQMNTGTLLGDQ